MKKIDLTQEKLKKALSECAVHRRRLSRAHQNLSSFFTLDEVSYQSLTEEQVEHTDQFIYRFMKLQDTMGARLFPGLLAAVGEEVESSPFVQLLSRLEKIGALKSKWEWQELREVQNQLAHEYTDDPKESAQQLNAIYAAGSRLIALFDHFETSTRKLLTDSGVNLGEPSSQKLIGGSF